VQPDDDASALADIASDWLARAIRLGLYNPKLDEKVPSSVTSSVDYDLARDLYTPKPRVVAHLRQTLADQNRYGFDDEAARTAGRLTDLTTPLSRGCPVAGRQIIGRTSMFAAKLLEANANAFSAIIEG
jgi:hypothetical protein